MSMGTWLNMRLMLCFFSRLFILFSLFCSLLSLIVVFPFTGIVKAFIKHICWLFSWTLSIPYLPDVNCKTLVIAHNLETTPQWLGSVLCRMDTVWWQIYWLLLLINKTFHAVFGSGVYYCSTYRSHMMAAVYFWNYFKLLELRRNCPLERCPRNEGREFNALVSLTVKEVILF